MKLNSSNDSIYLHGDRIIEKIKFEKFQNKIFFNNSSSLIISPQIINNQRYSQTKLVEIDEKIYSKLRNSKITTSSLDSVEFVSKIVRDTQVLFVPHLSFMIGNVRVKKKLNTSIDLLFLFQSDRLKNITKQENWKRLMSGKLNKKKSPITYLVINSNFLFYKNLKSFFN